MNIPLRAAAALVALLPILSATPVAAQSAVETLEKFGFFGEWAIRCDRPAAPNNVMRRAYLSASGEPGFSEDLGSNAAVNTYRILDVRAASSNEIVLDIELNNERRQTLTMMLDGQRIRTLRNELPDGRVLVNEGSVVANGAKTPWLNLCAKSP
jgi:hypothetical protein